MTSSSPRRKFKSVLWLTVLVALGGTAWFFSNQSSAISKGGVPEPEAINVTSALPVVRQIVEWDDFVGRLEAIDSVDVRARVSGYLTTTHFEEGQIVQAGQLLFVIDQRPFRAELARTKGDLDEAEGKVAQAQAAILQANAERDRSISHQELTRKQLERSRMLRAQNAVSEEDLDVAEAAALAANADIEVAKSKIAAAESSLVAANAAVEVGRANVELAELNLSFTEVLAPIEGRISRRNVTEGNMISGGSSESTVLTNIVSLHPIHCYFDVDERKYLDYIRLAQEGRRESSRTTRNPVYLSLADNKDHYPYKGYMDFVDNRVDRATGTMRGRAIIDNESLTLTPGMFTRIRLPGSAPHECVLIPDKAVGTDQNEKFVMIVVDKKVERRPVKLGPMSHGLRIVRTGLVGTEQVVISGLQRVREGSVVDAAIETVAIVEPPLPDTYMPVPADEMFPPNRRPAGNVMLTPVGNAGDFNPVSTERPSTAASLQTN